MSRKEGGLHLRCHSQGRSVKPATTAQKRITTLLTVVPKTIKENWNHCRCEQFIHQSSVVELRPTRLRIDAIQQMENIMKIQNIALASAVLLTLATAAITTGSAEERNGQGNIICPTGQAVDVTGQNCVHVPHHNFGRF